MGNGFNDQRGSNWRKWDLQVHTPLSILNNQFGDDFDEYVKQLFSRALASDISIIGITDYFHIEGYKLIKETYLSTAKLTTLGFSTTEIDRIKKILILPNIEFRLNKLVGTDRINFHVIFSNNVSIKDIEENFLHDIKFAYEGNPQDEEEKQRLKIVNLKNLGKKLITEHSKFKTDGSNLFVGMKNAVVDDGEIMTLLSKAKKFKGQYLIFVPSDEDLSKISWDGQDHQTRKVIIQKSDGLFTANKNTIAWGLGKKSRNEKEFITEFKTLKPSICGSDAHKYDELFERKDGRYCWIKADPTFEGLKQVIYELDGRVKIQELQPESKSDYNIIDRVEYKNKAGEAKVVRFNQNLNAIIGSRATGKSNLLKNIAYSVDPAQSIDRGVRDSDFYRFQDFKLLWKDATINSLNTQENKEKGIFFIPQGYLGNIVYEDDRHLGEFVVKLFGNKNDFATEISRYKQFEDDNALSITALIKEIISIRDTGKEKTELLKKLGRKENIEKDIVNLNKTIDLIQKKVGKITKEEIKNYQKLDKTKTEKGKEIAVIQKDIDSFIALKEIEVISSENIFEFDFSNALIKKIQEKIEESDESFKKNFIDKEILNLQKEQAMKNTELQKIIIALKPLREKIKKHKTILDLSNQLKQKEKVRQDIVKLNEEKAKLGQDYVEKQTNIIESYLKYSSEYKDFNLRIDDLEFSLVDIVTDFDKVSFIKFLEEYINYHNSKLFKEEGIPDKDKKYKNANAVLRDLSFFEFNKSFEVILKELLIGILSGKLLLKIGKDEESTLLRLFQNRFKINYLRSITKDGADFNDMSDGEKMIALLEFIFKFDDYNYPILLDQPEDDLDVRAMSKYVVGFLKKQKIKRQIFIVSHNANLVVCGDSEEVLVSEKKRKLNFEYKTGAIENKVIKKDIIEVLEGGEEAIRKRWNKLNIH
jgi:hypothetical protein